MAIKLNHLIIPAQDKVASAQLFADIFGLEVKPLTRSGLPIHTATSTRRCRR